MIILDNTNESLELLTGAAVSTDWSVSWADHTASAFTPAGGEGNVATATTTVIVAAPAGSTQRQIKSITVRNRGTTAQTVTIKKDIATTEYYVTPTVTLAGGEMLWIGPDGNPIVLDAAGVQKGSSIITSGYSGTAFPFFKVGTIAEAAGVRYCFSKDTGFPGAWAIGTSGLAGRATLGTAAADAGCIFFPNPASGAMYLTGFSAVQTVTGALELWDILWVNNGLTLATTTAETINSVAFPARDINGAVTGVGVEIAILVTVLTLNNAGAITNTTMSYTDAGGLGTQTATIASFPATAALGTVVPFQLAAGAKGVTQVLTMTKGTSYGTAGAISLIAYRPVAMIGGIVAAVGENAQGIDVPPGVRLFNGSALFPVRNPSATTLTTISGLVTMMER